MTTPISVGRIFRKRRTWRSELLSFWETLWTQAVGKQYCPSETYKNINVFCGSMQIRKKAFASSQISISRHGTWECRNFPFFVQMELLPCACWSKARSWEHLRNNGSFWNASTLLNSRSCYYDTQEKADLIKRSTVFAWKNIFIGKQGH